MKGCGMKGCGSGRETVANLYKSIDSIGNNGLNKGETGAQQKVRPKWKVASKCCHYKLPPRHMPHETKSKSWCRSGEDRDQKPNNLTILPR